MATFPDLPFPFVGWHGTDRPEGQTLDGTARPGAMLLIAIIS